MRRCDQREHLPHQYGKAQSSLLVHCYRWQLQFGVFMGFLLVLELSAAIAAYAMRGQIEDTIRQKMEQSIGEYYHDDYDKGIWDFTQQRVSWGSFF